MSVTVEVLVAESAVDVSLPPASTVDVATVTAVIDVDAPGLPGLPGATGPAGPAGAAGPAGPAGADGADGGVYHHFQGPPSDTWTVPHNLNSYPGGIIVIDSGGTQQEPHVEYIDENTIELTFYVAGVLAATSGDVYIS